MIHAYNADVEIVLLSAYGKPRPFAVNLTLAFLTQQTWTDSDTLV